jgi:methylglyoxal synthase
MLERETPEGFEALAGLGLVTQDAPPDKVLLEVGATPGRFAILRSGRVEVRTPLGERIRLDAPTVFGEMSFLGSIPAGAEVRSLSPVRLDWVDADTLNRWGVSAPRALAQIFAALSQVAIRRMSGQFHERYTALVAHDGRKDELLDLVREFRPHFESRSLLATATTGARLEADVGLPVARRVRSGPRGGDQEIGALVTRGLVEAVFFFRDPLWAQPHQADVDALVRVCELADVPLATNPATARCLLAGMRAAGVQSGVPEGRGISP